MPLERLRELPLSLEARLALLQEMLAAPQPERVRLELMVERAGLLHSGCEQAYRQQAWPEALEHHDALLALVEELAERVPAQGPVFWGRYGELLAFFTAAVHEAVSTNSPDPPPQLLRADLCWWLAERLERAQQLPIDPPEWLRVLEQQLVQDGALFWRELLLAGGADSQLAEPRTLWLFLRLQALLPSPTDWVIQAVRELLPPQLEAVLAGRQPEPVRTLLNQLALWPVEAAQQEAFRGALERTRLALELLAPELGPLLPPPAEVAAAHEQPAAEPEVAADLPAADLTAVMVLTDGAQPPHPARLELRPLLEAEIEAIDGLLEDFIWHLPKGCRALPAAQALPMALEPHWQNGLRLGAEAIERIAVLGAAWQRRLAPRLESLPTLEWQHGLLVELRPTELAVLRALLIAPEALDAALLELRREHHNPAFWQQRLELPWMRCLPPLEALRRLHLEEGFYANGHEPLVSLKAWGRQVLQALLEAELWTDDAACLGLWLALAQELLARGEGPLPPLGAPPGPEQLLAGLAGLEVLYVGERGEAVLAAHRRGALFRGGLFGLRVLEPPASRWPQRPAAGFEVSLDGVLAAVDQLYRQRPFGVILVDAGAYRLPLLRAVHQRYGVTALSSGLPMATWLGG